MTSIRCPLLILAALSALVYAASAAAYQDRRFQCPQMGMENCTSDDGLAFFDGCKTIACIGWHSAASDSTVCRRASSPEELSRCSQLSRRLEVIQRRARGEATPDVRVSCPQFINLDICATADQLYIFNDGCNLHLCDGSGGEFERTDHRCPMASTPEHLFFCEITFNSVVRAHSTRHACRAQVENADRICDVTWPGYRFGDACYDGNDFVCGPGRRLLTRPPPGMCPLASSSESIKCREVAAEITTLLSQERGYSCPELQRSVVCTEDNRGFVYNDGCNQVLCEGPGAGLTEGHACKLPFEVSNSAGRDFCRRQADEVHRRLAASRRHRGPCVSASEACSGLAAEGESYFDGCNYCTCLGPGSSQCTRRRCLGFFGTDAEFAAHCAVVATRLE